MKFDLKNRPRLFIQAENYADYYFKAEKWFEGFEKELRERILGFPESCQQCKNYNQQKMECRLLVCPYVEEATEIFREILGVELK